MMALCNGCIVLLLIFCIDRYNCVSAKYNDKIKHNLNENLINLDISRLKGIEIIKQETVSDEEETPKAGVKRVTDADKQIDSYLRIWKSVSRKARKQCSKACRSAYQNVCDDYKCSSRMKKSFKKNCKLECDDRF